MGKKKKKQQLTDIQKFTNRNKENKRLINMNSTNTGMIPKTKEYMIFIRFLFHEFELPTWT